MPTPRAALPLALLALACEPADPALLPIDEPIPGPTPRAQVRSCPAAPTPTPARLDPRFTVGEAGGVTWLFGQVDGGPALAHLAADGSLAITAVPLSAQAGAIDGSRVWLYAPNDTAPARLLSVDVADPDLPTIGEVMPSPHDEPALTAAAAFAVSDRRILLVTGDRAARQVVLLDAATRAPIAPPHAFYDGFEPLHATCAADRCAVVAVIDDETQALRRLVALRVSPDGAVARETIAPVWAGQPHTAEQGDRVIVSWPDEHNLYLRVLDRSGEFLGPVVPVPGDRNTWNRQSALLHAGGAVMLALAEEDRWSVAPVGPHGTIGPRRQIPGAGLQGLRGAPLDDGLAWLGFGGEVSHNEFGSSVLTQTWRAEVHGGFLPLIGDPPPLRSLVRGDGDGDGRFEPHVLVRPGAAAALIVPRGDAGHDSDPVIVPLRAACPPQRRCAAAEHDSLGCGAWFSRVLPLDHLHRAALAGLRRLHARIDADSNPPIDDAGTRCQT